MSENDALEPRVSRLEGGQEAVISTLEKLSKNVEALSDKVDRKTTPNRGDQIASLAVFLSFLGMVTWAGVRECDQLDTRLQRELHQVNDTTLERINSLDKLSIMRHDEAVLLTGRNLSRVERLEDWNQAQVKADLEELRQRRMTP